MSPEEREVLERAIQRVIEQAANADAIVDEAMATGLDGSDRMVVGTKMLRAYETRTSGRLVSPLR